MSNHVGAGDAGYFKAVTIDDCPDADGNWTMRFADGTLHGDITVSPIATFYNKDIAEVFAKNWNALGQMVAMSQLRAA